VCRGLAAVVLCLEPCVAGPPKGKGASEIGTAWRRAASRRAGERSFAGERSLVHRPWKGAGPVAGSARPRCACRSSLLRALRLLRILHVKRLRQKLEDLLADEFGVSREFAIHLMPLLEMLASTQPGAAEWERALRCLAAAYHSRTEELESFEESRVLVRQFISELKQMDESLKVIGVYLERLRDTLANPIAPRTLH